MLSPCLRACTADCGPDDNDSGRQSLRCTVGWARRRTPDVGGGALGDSPNVRCRARDGLDARPCSLCAERRLEHECPIWCITQRRHVDSSVGHQARRGRGRLGPRTRTPKASFGIAATWLSTFWLEPQNAQIFSPGGVGPPCPCFYPLHVDAENTLCLRDTSAHRRHVTITLCPILVLPSGSGSWRCIRSARIRSCRAASHGSTIHRCHSESRRAGP
jgi:hypothetical protein